MGDSEQKLLKQAAAMERRYTYEGKPARGVSLFAARSEPEARAILAGKLRIYPRYRAIPASLVTDRIVLVPTFGSPHWTVLFRSPSHPRDEHELIDEFLSILGPVQRNPKHHMARRAEEG